ncbi:sensor histidine kinase [Kitasatospora sp. NPDC091335]|uniref:sensor histidine kinase n=1 Tax=Kitasatospora sp. NPDC091335 TaxID=3364085 RepID=UPI00382B1690
MPAISATRPGHRAGRSGSLRGRLLALTLVPTAGLLAAWGYAGFLLRDTGHRTALLAGSAVVALVVLVSLLHGVRTALTLSARLSGLRAETLSLARQEIPEVVGRLRAGEQVPVPPVWTPSRRIGDEVQQSADGLAAVRQVTVAAIVHQARGREGTKKVFLNIARRTQILIHRQISMLDALEREHEDPELLRELFAVDHLATRMRRNAENLVILGGALPARRWRNAVPVVNVLRSAVSETESYSRVVVQGVPRVSLGGQAVADVIHLVAELIENGTTFSPPYTQVQVSAQEVPRGLAVEVEDRGLGMTEEEYERLNTYLANPPELDVSALGDDLRLGLFVVARLAARHEVQVTLRPSPYGGTRAVVLVPSALLEQAGQSAAVPGLPSGARITRTPVSEQAPTAAGPEDDSVTGSEPEYGAGAGTGSGYGSRSEYAAEYGAGQVWQGSREPTDAMDATDATDAPGGATGGGFGALLGGGQGAPGSFGTAGAPAVPYAAAPPEAPAVHAPDGAGPGTAGSGDALAGSASTAAAGRGGLPVGALIPGLPGAVVVPRPVLPRRYELPTGPASAPGPGSDGGPGNDLAGAPAGVPGGGGTADHSAPVHRYFQEGPAEQGQDGELRTPRTLPQRVRNASLAEQLRVADAPGTTMPSGPVPQPHQAQPPVSPLTPAHGSLPGAFGHRHDSTEADDPSPTRSRATMAAIQRGTLSARAARGEPDVPVAPTRRAAPSAPRQAPAEAPAVQESEEQQ